MRPIAFVLATFVASAPAAAQGWEEYSYPDYAFSVAFPANPQVDTTTYKIADNRSNASLGRLSKTVGVRAAFRSAGLSSAGQRLRKKR